VASAFNGLTQRTKVELECQGHKVTVQLFTSPTDVESAVEASQPDLIICPFLKDRLPASVYEDHICLIVHPGVMGDKGPSSLDWALTEGKTMSGVTVLQVS
jgi:putative two-component system hydrogenase maturation factor HypX/HoxX